VHAGDIQPLFSLVGDALRRTDDHGAGATDADEFGDLADGPYPVRIGDGKTIDGRMNRLAADMLDAIVLVVSREIDAGPARHQRERAVAIDILPIVVQPLVCFL